MNESTETLINTLIIVKQNICRQFYCTVKDEKHIQAENELSKDLNIYSDGCNYSFLMQLRFSQIAGSLKARI